MGNSVLLIYKYNKIDFAVFTIIHRFFGLNIQGGFEEERFVLLR